MKIINECFYGLSKIELLSGLAMQGLLSNLTELRKNGFKDDDISEFSLIMAHKLLIQINKHNTTENPDPPINSTD